MKPTTLMMTFRGKHRDAAKNIHLFTARHILTSTVRHLLGVLFVTSHKEHYKK
jgi:hypothetical protein